MSQKQHARSGSHGRKVVSASSRPSRPAFLTKRTGSYHQGMATQRSPTQASATLSAGAAKDGMYRHEESDDESMLQYCATCEKQIVTPGAHLYCSEACRKRDSVHHDTFSLMMPSPPLTPSSSLFDMSNYSHVDIIPQRSPTVLRPLSMTFSELSLSDHGSFGALDSDYQQRRHHSEATGSSSSLAAAGRRRGQDNRASADSYIPSLSHSPSSSYSTVASAASYQRPRLPRHNPYASSFTTKSIELVLPQTPAAMASNSTASAIAGLKDASLESSVSTLTSYRIADSRQVRRPTNTSQSVAPHATDAEDA